jgi:hypothetical protein
MLPMQVDPQLDPFILLPNSLDVHVEPASSIEMGGRVHSFPLGEEVAVPELDAESEWLCFGPSAFGVDIGRGDDIG